jgi:hypothetical protein
LRADVLALRLQAARRAGNLGQLQFVKCAEPNAPWGGVKCAHLWQVDRWPWEDCEGVDGWTKADYAPLG